MKNRIFYLNFILLFFLISCAKVKVTRMESNEIVDLSGDWNDSDSQIVSKAIINECLGSAWIGEFLAKNGYKPVVIVGTILNKTDEHINIETFVKDLEKELVNSGRVKFVASSSERGELRVEKNEQEVFASEDTKKKKYNETGADFMLKGQLNNIFDTFKKESIKYYQVELELINIENNEKVWIGQKKIKKLVKRSKYKI